MRFLLCFCFSLIATALSAQTVQGLVRDAENSAVLFPVTVVNMTTQASTYTDSKGRFSLAAQPGDAVVFSLNGYKTVQRKVPPVMGVLEWQVGLEPMNYMLNEVLVRPKFTPYQLDSIERRSNYQRALARQKSTPMSPFSLLAERMSRRQRNLFRFQKEFERMERDRFIESRYTPELVHQMTGLTGDTVGYFINQNPIPMDFVRAATDLELKMWIRTQYRAWISKPLVLPNLPPDSTGRSGR